MGDETAKRFAVVLEEVRRQANAPAISVPTAIVPPWWPIAFTIECDVCSKLAVRVYEGATAYPCFVLDCDECNDVAHSLIVCAECSRELGGRPAVHAVPWVPPTSEPR